MDKNTGLSFKKILTHKAIAVKISALLLMAIGLLVPIAWHNPHLFPDTYLLITAMAYNTAICFLLAGIGLLALHLHKVAIVRFCGCIILVVSIVRLIEIIVPVNLHSSDWFYLLITTELKTSIYMHPTTASNFVVIGITLLLPRLATPEAPNLSALWAVFFGIAIIITALITFLGNGMSILPSFIWFGIKIALLTVLGFITFSIGVISQLAAVAIHTFNCFNFFKRLIIGFGFMSVLFVGIGSVAFMQIHSVVSLTQELYQNPLQVNYSALRIKNEINQLNREIKDIAVDPARIDQLDIRQKLGATNKILQSEMQVIREKEPTLIEELQELDRTLEKWRNFIMESELLLRQGDTKAFRERTLYQTQEDSIVMESLADQLIRDAQRHILELNQVVLDTEKDAKNLLIISIAGLLGIGLLVAFLITRSIAGQLQKIRHAMLNIAHGKSGTLIPFLDDQEEIGDMAKTLEIFARNIAIRQRMETRMSKIIEATPNGIIMINRDGLIEVFNHQAEKIFGYSRDDIIGKPIEKLIPLRMTGNHPKFRQDFFNAPTPRAMGVGRDLFGLKQDGSEFPLEIGLAPIETEEGVKVLASVVDISERKKSEQTLKEHQMELERSNARLAQTNKELETFAYVASHDLKSPLRGIAQLSSWIEEDLAEKEFDNIDNHTGMLRNRIQRMEKLLDDLLVFYRAGKTDGNLTSIDVNQMAKDLFEIQNNKPGLRLEIMETLPTFSTLGTPFEQVMRNLLSNAIKHHDKSEGSISISYREAEKNFYRFSVCDDGPGIPKQFQERVFGMFQTLKPRDELEGSGMGLALIKKIVENYGGKITVESEGRGTCFHFTWPRDIKGRNGHA